MCRRRALEGYLIVEDMPVFLRCVSFAHNIREPCSPASQLQESDHIEYHGPTSVWRLRAQRTSPAVSEAQGSVSPEPAPAVPSTYFDWSRHLPSEIPLSRSEHDRLLEILFKFGVTWSLRFIPDLFVRDMHRALSLPPNAPPPRLAHYSPMLHNAALALATAYSDDPVIKDMRNRRLYALRAKSYIEADTQKPTIALVTAFSTLAVFHSTCGEQSLGYLYFGKPSPVICTQGVTLTLVQVWLGVSAKSVSTSPFLCCCECVCKPITSWRQNGLLVLGQVRADHPCGHARPKLDVLDDLLPGRPLVPLRRP